jgi:hypothetical protein
MKKYLFCLLIPVFAFCMNEGGTTQKKSGITVDNNEMPAGGCGSLVFFHKGAIVKGSTYDSAGKETSSQVSTITDVKTSGSNLVGTVKMDMSSSFGNRTMNVDYTCDGNNLAVDLQSMMGNFRALKGAKTEATSLKFPIKLSVGQSLPDASLSITMDRGNMKMKTVSTHVGRKVESIEKVTTPGGTWNCYKVVSDIKTTTDYGNAEMQKRMEAVAGKTPGQKMVAWFAPDFGIVKMEMFLGNKMITRSMVTSVKQ